MINYQLFTKYFNQDLAKQLRSEDSYLSNRYYFNLSDEEILCANMFISIFEAGDKFEGNSYNIANHIDLSSYVANTYPQLHKLIPYYCKVYNIYRNYAWKSICCASVTSQDRYVRIEKFFCWWRTVITSADDCVLYPTDPIALWDQQIKEDITNGSFTLKPFVRAYLHLVKDNDIIIVLPKSMRIIRLINEMSVDGLLSQNNLFLCQTAENVESAIAEIVNGMLDEDSE